MTHCRLPLLAALLLFCTDATAQESSIAEQTISQWESSREVILTEAVRILILEEATKATQRIQESPKLRHEYVDTQLGNALLAYLDINLRNTESPPLLSILHEEISPGGLMNAFPTKYPVLVLMTSFDLTGLVINSDTITFEPVRSQKVLLEVGDNDIATIGGGPNDCSYEIDAAKGNHYIRKCPNP